MNKIFSTLVAFCLGLFVSISIIACAEEFVDNESGNDSELQVLSAQVALLRARVEELEKGDHITYYNYSNNYGEWWSAAFNYDAEGRIVSVNCKNSEGANSTDNVSYTEIGCTFGGVTITGTTITRALNRAITGYYISQ